MPSYSPVFSQGFIYGTPSSPVSSFAVPEGFTAVIRQWSVYGDISDFIAQLVGQNSAEAPRYVLDTQAQVGIAVQTQGQGRWVVPGGGIISIFVSSLGSTPSWYVGGYLLRNSLT